MRGICGPRPGEVDLVNESLDASSPVAPFGVSKRAEGDDSGKPCVVGQDELQLDDNNERVDLLFKRGPPKKRSHEEIEKGRQKKVDKHFLGWSAGIEERAQARGAHVKEVVNTPPVHVLCPRCMDIVFIADSKPKNFKCCGFIITPRGDYPCEKNTLLKSWLRNPAVPISLQRAWTEAGKAATVRARIEWSAAALANSAASTAPRDSDDENDVDGGLGPDFVYMCELGCGVPAHICGHRQPSGRRIMSADERSQYKRQESKQHRVAQARNEQLAFERSLVKSADASSQRQRQLINEQRISKGNGAEEHRRPVSALPCQTSSRNDAPQSAAARARPPSENVTVEDLLRNVGLL